MCINENVIACDQIHEHKQEFRIVLLTVDIPRIITPMKNFTYIANEVNSIIFECSASGIPAPTISWFRIIQTMSTMLVNSTQSLIASPQVNSTYKLPDGIEVLLPWSHPHSPFQPHKMRTLGGMLVRQ